MRRPMVLVGMLVLLAGSIMAQVARPVPGFIAQFSPEEQNLIVIFDPLPHLEAILKYPPLRQALIGRSEGPVAKKNGKPDSDDPLQMLASMRAFSAFIPQEIAIGISDRGMRSMDPLMRSVILSMLTTGAMKAEHPQDRTKYQTQLAAAAKQLRVPDITVYLRMRDANGARTIRQLMRGQLTPRTVPGLTIANVGTEGFRAMVPLGQLLDKETYGSLLFDAEGVDVAPEVWEHIAGLQAHLLVQQVGDGLRISVAGDAPGEPKGLDASKLGSEFAGDAATIMALRWDLSQMKKDAQGWIELWAGSKGTETGDAARELDDEGALDSLTVSLSRLQDTGDQGVMRIWRDDELRVSIDEVGVPKSESLRDSSVARLIPANAGMWHATTLHGLGDLIADQLLQADERLDRQRLQAQLGGGSPDKVDAVEKMAQAYYGQLAGLRKLLLNDVPEAFAPGAGLLLQPEGMVKKLEVRMPSNDGDVSATITDWPIMRLALLGRPTSWEKADALIEEVYTEAMQGMVAISETKSKLPEELVQDFDLQPGVKARRLVLWSPQSESGEPLLSMEDAAEFMPHYFMVDDVLVFSTSQELSRAILAAGAGKERMPLPLAEGTLISAGSAPVSVLERVIDSIFALAEISPDAARTPQGTLKSAQSRKTVTAVIKLMKRADWRVEQGENRRQTHFELMLAAP